MIRRTMVYIFGLIVACLGISIIIKSNMGAGPWEAVFVGLNSKFGLTVGAWVIIGQMIIALFTSLIEKKRPQFESIITILLWGWIIDFWLYFGIRNISISETITTQLTSFVLGITLAGLGIGIYVTSGFPRIPVDDLMLNLQKKFGWSLNIARGAVEIPAVLIALGLRGPVGLGTLIIAAFIGQIVQLSNTKTKSLLDTYCFFEVSK